MIVYAVDQVKIDAANCESAGKKPSRQQMRTGILVVLLIVLSIMSVFIGNIELRLSDLINGDEAQFDILLLTRLPRLAAVIITGAGMSVCGSIMQQIARNKFISPTTGASVQSASLGLLTATIFFQPLATRRLWQWRRCSRWQVRLHLLHC